MQCAHGYDRNPGVCLKENACGHFRGKTSSIFWEGRQIWLEICTVVDFRDVTTRTTIFSNPFLCYSSQGVCFLGLSQLVFMFLTDSLLLFPIHCLQSHCFQSHFYFLAIFCFCWVIISVVSSGTSALLSNFFCRVLKVFCSERTVRCKRFFGPWQTHSW